ncbi:MAG: Wzz/FepE/Etk N-terminal domain-containing protein [Pseudomonadota bacterium]
MTQHNQATAPGGYDPALGGLDQIQPLDVVAMLRVLWHGKWLILCATLLMVILAGYYAFRVATPQYEAVATIQLEGATDPLGGADQAVVDDAALNTKVALVTSNAVLAQVVSRLDLLSDPELNRYLTAQSPWSFRNLRTQARHLLAGTTPQAPSDTAIHEKTIQNLRGLLTVSRKSDTYILHIRARSGDPDKAALLANRTAQEFLTHTQALQAQARVEADVWLQSRITELRGQIETQEMQIAALIATAQLQQDRGLDTLSAQILAADQDLTEARNALAMLEIAPDSGSARNTAEMAQMERRITDLAASKERLSAQLSVQSAGLAQLHQLQLQTDATRQLYQTFLGRLHENRMQQGLGTPQAQRIAPATEGSYIGPRKMLILAIAAMLGAAIGVLLVIIRHNMRKGIIDARGLRAATGLPILAQFSTRSMRPLRRGARAFPLSPQSDLSQAAQALNTALALATRSNPAQVILSTSSIQAEGKSEHALLLAQTMARAGKRVLVIGADENDRQLATWLSADVVQAAQANWNTPDAQTHSAALGADILMLPPAKERQGVVIGDDLLRRLEGLRKRYDHIIIDGPPVLLTPFARLLAAHADAIIYAVRWSTTPQDILQRGLEALAETGCPATGLILSKVNLRKMRKLSNDPYVSMLQTAHT